MSIAELIDRQKVDILKNWHQSIINTYPKGASNFLNETKNKFANPIGYTINKSLPSILDAVIYNDLSEAAKNSLDAIIRIRAVQDFEPSQALSFINSLKAIIYSEISGDIKTDKDFLEVLKLEKIFNTIFDFSINLYVSFREKVYEIKANEQMRTFEKMLERLNQKYEDLTTIN